MSDFKYEAINAALEFCLKSDDDVLRDIAQWCVSGAVPVVDMTSVEKHARDNFDSYLKTSRAFVELAKDGKWIVPIETFVGFSFVDEWSDREIKGARVSLCSLGNLLNKSPMGYESPFLSQSLMVLIRPGFAPVVKETVSFCTDVMCMWIWMGSKNSESEDSTAPRHFRRRREVLASVRFRKVFIRPLRKGSPRYEITGEACPLHHVRGHIRHVSEDKPLFGRKGNHGTFWISEHWRGDEDNGRIVQEYVVNQPDA